MTTYEFMKRLILAAFLAGTAFPGLSIQWEYDNFDINTTTCRIKGWSGQQPSSGKLVIKDTYEKDGVTYKINEIAPGALNHLTTVTEITIGANIGTIGGNCYARPWDDISNFNNCPKLKLFHVSSDNTTYGATAGGLLIRFEEQADDILVRVPQAVNTNNGKLTLGSGISDAAQNAFSENTTISTLALSKKFEELHVSGVFANMRGLKAIEAPGNPFLKSQDGILYNEDLTEIICYPVLREGASFTVPATVLAIDNNAFLGAQKLKTIDLSGVSAIRKNAFAKSALSKVTLPASLTDIGEGAFRDCSYISSVTFEGQHSLGQAAFKGCHALTTANLSVDIKFDRDSVFEGCGFKSIVFPAGSVPQNYDIGSFSFANTPIELLDLSALDTSEHSISLMGNITKGCNKLTTVKLPTSVSIARVNLDESCTFGANSAIKELSMGTFSSVGAPAFLYTEGNHMPRLYVQATDAEVCRWYFQAFFEVQGEASVRPLIFIDAYKLLYNGEESDWYVYPTASYYVPALARKNYTKAIAAGVTVSEMFELTVDKNSGEVHVVNRYPNDITFQSVSVDGGELEPFDAANNVNLGTELKNGTTLRIYYKFRDTQFKTDYPIAEIATSGIESATTDHAVVKHEVYTLSGTFVAAGDGEADLTTLPPGVYVVRSADAAGNTTVSKVTNK